MHGIPQVAPLRLVPLSGQRRHSRIAHHLSFFQAPRPSTSPTPPALPAIS